MGVPCELKEHHLLVASEPAPFCFVLAEDLQGLDSDLILEGRGAGSSPPRLNVDVDPPRPGTPPEKGRARPGRAVRFLGSC